jgi:hypothetical protein
MHPAKHQRRPTAMKSNSGNGEALCSTTNVRPVQSYCSVHQPRSSPVSPSTRLLLPVMLVASAVLLHHGQVVAANGSTAQPETTTMGSGGGPGLVAEAPTTVVQKSMLTCAELGSAWEMRSSGRHGADLDICVMANFNGVCHNGNNRDWATGELLCLYEGARLCTLDEITVGVLQNTGCNLGTRHIWTNTAVSQKSADPFVRPLFPCTFSVSGFSLVVFKLSLFTRLHILFEVTIFLKLQSTCGPTLKMGF